MCSVAMVMCSVAMVMCGVAMVMCSVAMVMCGVAMVMCSVAMVIQVCVLLWYCKVHVSSTCSMSHLVVAMMAKFGTGSIGNSSLVASHRRLYMASYIVSFLKCCCHDVTEIRHVNCSLIRNRKWETAVACVKVCTITCIGLTMIFACEMGWVLDM